MELILKKCAFDYSPVAVVFFEKLKLAGWTVKVQMAARTYEFFYNSEQAPLIEDVKYFIETSSKLK